MSLVLYCDYSAYCTEFSSTFRRISVIESMEDVKKSNSRFWHQSKNLREMVECYGRCNNEGMLHEDIHTESGPFYTGLDAVLAVPEFSIRLCSPTSTSKHMEVSINFSTKEGIIIQLNNPKEDLRSALVSFFDVSWISCFPDEDERVFIGMIVCCIVYKL